MKNRSFYVPRLMRQLTTIMTTAEPASKDESEELLKRINKNKIAPEELLALLILKYAGYKSYSHIVDVIKIKADFQDSADVGHVLLSLYDEDAETYEREIVIDNMLSIVVIEKEYAPEQQSINSAIVDHERLSQISHDLAKVGYKEKIVSATVALESARMAPARNKGEIIRSYCAGNSRVDVVYLRYDLALGSSVIVYANRGKSPECE